MLTKANLQQLPVFILSMSRWDGDTSSASLALAKVLSRTNPVYYIDFPYSVTDYWRGRHDPAVQRRKPALWWGKDFLHSVEGQPANFNVATPKLVLPFYSLQPGAVYNRVSHCNNLRVASLVKKIIREKGIGDYLFLNSFNPSYLADIRRYLQPTLSLYQSRDAIEETHLPSISRENDCVRHYDLTMATSQQICRNIQHRTSVEAAYLPNGGDVSLFRTAMDNRLEKPAELRSIQTPVIGYTGAVCQRIDYELVVKLANAHPDKTIVFVGPRRDKQYTTLDLDALPNVVFTGPKKLEELPAYLQHFDCTIIPFLKNGLTAGIYPLKINEYLAAGKAVVTTDFSDDINAFAAQVSLAGTHEAFVRLIDKALADNSPARKEERWQAARQNSWEHRVEQFWELALEGYQKRTFRQQGLWRKRRTLVAV